LDLKNKNPFIAAIIWDSSPRESNRYVWMAMT